MADGVNVSFTMHEALGNRGKPMQVLAFRRSSMPKAGSSSPPAITAFTWQAETPMWAQAHLLRRCGWRWLRQWCTRTAAEAARRLKPQIEVPRRKRQMWPPIEHRETQGDRPRVVCDQKGRIAICVFFSQPGDAWRRHDTDNLLLRQGYITT